MLEVLTMPLHDLPSTTNRNDRPQLYIRIEYCRSARIQRKILPLLATYSIHDLMRARSILGNALSTQGCQTHFVATQVFHALERASKPFRNRCRSRPTIPIHTHLPNTR